jgi:hypothetical protein
LKKIYQACRNWKQVGVAILISNKADFKQKSVRRDKEGHYRLIKGTIQQEEITILNIYALNIGAKIHETNTSEHKGWHRSRYNKSVRFQHPFSSIDRASWQIIDQDILELNNTMDKT